jgi:hypothetical protein
MTRETRVTLHRNRNGTSEDRLIDEGTALDMVGHIMNQPRVKRSEYSIMDGATVYQPSEIGGLAHQFGLVEEEAAATDKDILLFS